MAYQRREYNQPIVQLYLVQMRITSSKALSDIITELMGQGIKSIHGIFRVYDWELETPISHIHLAVYDRRDYWKLINEDIVIDSQSCIVANDDFTLMSVTKTNEEFPGIPATIKATGVKALAGETSSLAAAILHRFERESAEGEKPIGVSLIRDERRDTVRPFAFISFMNVEHASEFVGIQFRIFDQPITCEVSFKVPVVVERRDMREFNRQRNQYNLTTHSLNRLFCDVLDLAPMPQENRQVNVPPIRLNRNYYGRENLNNAENEEIEMAEV